MPRLARAGVESLREGVAFFADARETSRALKAGGDPVGDAIGSIAAGAFWLHVDLDVLASEALSGVDYPQEGGLAWDELDRLAASAAGHEWCRGASVVIYNPDLDPDRTEADAIVAFLSRLMRSVR